MIETQPTAFSAVRFPDRNNINNMTQCARGFQNLNAVLKRMGFDKLRKGQDGVITSIMCNRDTLCVLPTATGKSFKAGELILMFDGSFKKVEDVKVGDVVMGHDSQPRPVIGTHSGEDDLFEVIPKKGESYTVNSEHVLSLKITGMRKRRQQVEKVRCGGSQFTGGSIANVAVKDYLASNKTFKHCAKGWRVGVEFPEVPTLTDMPPYILGLWLGDGSVGSPCITKPDKEVEDAVRAYAGTLEGHTVRGDKNESGCPSYHIATPEDMHGGCKGGGNRMINALRELGVFKEKHIPFSYSRNSREKRLELLAGLLDSDGYLHDGGFDWIQKSKRLADDMVFLCRSLGFSATAKECTKTCQGGFSGTYYRMYVSGDLSQVPCRIPRRISPKIARRKNTLLDGIKVVPAGRGKYYGFEVEGKDSLFLLADFTVVHNSACFTIPTLALEWRTLIFVPLVALMRDQVQSLWRKGISEAGCLSSLQSEGENVQVARDWMSGKLRFLFVAPERLRNPWFQQAMKAVPPDLIAVDEAHCLSEHGDDFRPDYCKIGDYLRENPPKVVAAFSATVDEEAELDIRRVLCMNNAVKVTHMPRRKNLILSSSDLTHDNDVVDFLEEKIKEKESFVVYCSTVKHVEEFTIFLQANLKGEVGMYHGKLTPAQKRSMQDEFMKDRVPGVVATNAFGMGVDKAGIRAVVYRDMPGNLGELSQGQGRAGRDGNISHCHTFFDDNGLRTQNWFLMTKYPSESAVRSVFLALKKLQKPNGMVQASYDDIAKVAQGHAAQIGAALQNLKAAAVIESTRPETRNHKIKFLDEVPKTQDLRFEEYKHIINQIGVEDANTGLLMVDAETLAERIDVGDQTIRNNLRKYQSAGFLYFEPPYTGSDIKIIGGIERMEFGRLKDKQAAAEKKLKMVLDYNHVPDDQKHSFLEKYFGITEPSE